MNKIIHVYVGHKLTDATESFITEMRDTFDYVFSQLAQCKRVPFLGLKWESAAQVYHADIVKGVGGSDVAILVLDEQADGVIAEMYAALYKYGIPTVLLHKGRRKISGLIRGTVETYPERYLFEMYARPEHVVDIVKRAISKFDLDTDHPVRFPCLVPLRSNAESLIRAGIKPIMVSGELSTRKKIIKPPY